MTGPQPLLHMSLQRPLLKDFMFFVLEQCLLFDVLQRISPEKPYHASKALQTGVIH